jgi:hypothetical protein
MLQYAGFFNGNRCGKKGIRMNYKLIMLLLCLSGGLYAAAEGDGAGSGAGGGAGGGKWPSADLGKRSLPFDDTDRSVRTRSRLGTRLVKKGNRRAALLVVFKWMHPADIYRARRTNKLFAKVWSEKWQWLLKGASPDEQVAMALMMDNEWENNKRPLGVYSLYIRAACAGHKEAQTRVDTWTHDGLFTDGELNRVLPKAVAGDSWAQGVIWIQLSSEDNELSPAAYPDPPIDRLMELVRESYDNPDENDDSWVILLVEYISKRMVFSGDHIGQLLEMAYVDHSYAIGAVKHQSSQVAFSESQISVLIADTIKENEEDEWVDDWVECVLGEQAKKFGFLAVTRDAVWERALEEGDDWARETAMILARRGDVAKAYLRKVRGHAVRGNRWAKNVITAFRDGGHGTA